MVFKREKSIFNTTRSVSSLCSSRYKLIYTVDHQIAPGLGDQRGTLSTINSNVQEETEYNHIVVIKLIANQPITLRVFISKSTGVSARTKFLFWSEILHLSRKLFAMARPILCSQEDLNAVEMQDVTSEGHNTLAQDVRGKILGGIVQKVCHT